MATLTPNLSLSKPELSEQADIAVLNANMDNVDSFAGSAQSQLNKLPNGIEMAKAHRSDQNVPNGLGSWTVMDLDSLSSGETTTGISRNGNSLQVSKAGVYLATVYTAWDGDSSGSRGVRVTVGGSAYSDSGFMVEGFSGNTNIYTYTLPMILGANDRVRIEVRQSSGGSLRYTASLRLLLLGRS